MTAGHRLTRILDRSAIGLSFLCLAHCLAFPMLIAFLPALATVLPQGEWVHPLLLAIALPLAGVALWRGWRRHRAVQPLAFGAIGLALMTIGVDAGASAEIVLTVAGGLALAGAHLLNWRLDRG